MRFLLAVCISFCLCMPLLAIQATQEAKVIALAIADEIQTSQPVFLELDCGDWTSALTQELSALLIQRKLDLRIARENRVPDFGSEAEEAQSFQLQDYGLDSALLVQVKLNLKWQEQVQRNFFSYRRDRLPVYSFETMQILLPEQRLLKLSSYDFSRPQAREAEASNLRMRWFEPLIAGAAIGSMIFLLWNFD